MHFADNSAVHQRWREIERGGWGNIEGEGEMLRWRGKYRGGGGKIEGKGER